MSSLHVFVTVSSIGNDVGYCSLIVIQLIVINRKRTHSSISLRRYPSEAVATALLVVRLGTAIPDANANVGSLQFFTVLALRLFGEDKTIVAGFSMVYFLALTAPLLDPWPAGH